MGILSVVVEMESPGKLVFAALWQQGRTLTFIIVVTDLVDDRIQFFVCIEHRFAECLGNCLVSLDFPRNFEEIVSGIPKNVFPETDGAITGRREISVNDRICMGILDLM